MATVCKALGISLDNHVHQPQRPPDEDRQQRQGDQGAVRLGRSAREPPRARPRDAEVRRHRRARGAAFRGELSLVRIDRRRFRRRRPAEPAPTRRDAPSWPTSTARARDSSAPNRSPRRACPSSRSVVVDDVDRIGIGQTRARQLQLACRPGRFRRAHWADSGRCRR